MCFGNYLRPSFVTTIFCSPVDVDAAVCIAEELDQLDDVLKIVYKLRHSEMTGRMLPSTEYALIRLLLKHHKTDILLAVLADPVSNLLFKKNVINNEKSDNYFLLNTISSTMNSI